MATDDFFDELFKTKDTLEAMSWLKEEGVPERSLGEASDKEYSIALVQSLYEAGSEKVWVFDIDGEPNEEQNSGRLIIELPDDKGIRSKILKKYNEIGSAQGFDLEPDTGQQYILLMLD